ncbi:MAG: hypothetical protein RMJ37_00320 [Spirochaetia bacterium]|nr:hypothetical protein [Spirochaetota bacterium]MCX8097032.1 hypothetical protein [Spirochaetota bacterium]MDW8111773.1 hypothetical protein [Spirochaetia bacterium]
MNPRYSRKTSLIEKITDTIPLPETIVVIIIFLITLGLLILPKEILFKISTIPILNF